MPTAIKQITVGDLIQELQNSPADTPVTLKNSDGENFLVVGFEVGSDNVNIIVTEDDSDDDEDGDDVPA
ncbi:MAG: hypothetical protein V7L23_23740 [Nostoc sp.]|uniref:hypothetical protein n=1 Tax=Nostoc sp. TaxID=1180 RepID=UPI002FF02297